MVNMYSEVSQAVKNAGMSAIFVGFARMPGDIAIGRYSVDDGRVRVHTAPRTP